MNQTLNPKLFHEPNPPTLPHVEVLVTRGDPSTRSPKKSISETLYLFWNCLDLESYWAFGGRGGGANEVKVLSLSLEPAQQL